MDKEKNIRQIADIIIKALRGELSREESSAFSDWLEQSEKNRELFQRVSEEAHIEKEYAQFLDVDAQRAWKCVLRRQRRHLRMRILQDNGS